MAAAQAGAASVVANDIDLLSLVAARLNAQANELTVEVSDGLRRLAVEVDGRMALQQTAK